jgi:hypothetical protein
MLDGSCHCGAIRLELETTHAPADLPVRLCGCSFCLRHRPRYTSDPTGLLEIRASESSVSRYRFGLELADFLICRTCGVFVAAYEPGEPGRAVINLDVLAKRADFVAAPTMFLAYDTEGAATRTARRARNWTPARLVAHVTRDLPPTAWRTQPWKNGGGVTHEILRWPDVDDYDVRISVAEVARSGPFSLFPGYWRTIIMIGSAPIELAMGKPSQLAALTGPGVRVGRLSEIGHALTIDGNHLIDATLPAGPTTLFNVISRADLPVNIGIGRPDKLVRFVFALDDGDLPRGHARLFDPPERIDQRVIWIE